MKRAYLMATVCVFWAAGPALAQVGLGGSGRAGKSQLVFPGDLSRPVRAGQAMNPIRAMLLSKVERVSFDETPFSDVLEWLRGQSTEQGTVNVVARWRALEAESINEDSPVTLEMRDSTTAEVLNEVLDQLSDLEPITYIGMNNTLRISTKTNFDQKLYMRVYDLQDLFLEIRNFRGSPQIDLNQRQQGQGGGGGGGGSGGQAQVQSIFGQSGGGGGSNDDDDDDEDDIEREDEIMTKLKLAVEPDSWDDAGGLGTMVILNRQLIVRNTLSVHELLGGSYHHGE